MTAISAYKLASSAGDSTVVDGGGQRNGPNKRSRSLSSAKSKFMESVRRGVDDLMQHAGYSRERATSALLRELGRVGSTPPTDDEIFHMMTIHGVGMSVAEQCLVVSKTVRKLMKEDGMSAVEAIDDLTSRLSLTNFVADDEERKSSHKPEKTVLKNSVGTNRTPSSPSVMAAERARKTPSSARKVAKQKVEKLKGLDKIDFDGKKPKMGKFKRALPGKDEKEGPPKGRARADSITEVVNAKMEASAQDTPASNVRVPRSKRAAHSDATKSQPKRQRTAAADYQSTPI
mmetsp:Transcript_14234/g.20866  ORF Transcript_14234/g.20866 Transcript_14234/m.20866 type:complete len:288 (-) Transcript_14234:190-1053(-)|eukprot:CAMPEP_0194048142 /NCGR_PEP_ID=MMETSP0009_2-20130614/26751_1 /TAXON_ID=210454 /ORGANISM="Grammatophora oceanica, Strain CCMP 410" /LENGTH=287 /DNA_ID=CAMNT_0038693955 /DNA_START=136 /DNA_END=999 /DNA_ORIENTATION=+